MNTNRNEIDKMHFFQDAISTSDPVSDSSERLSPVASVDAANKEVTAQQAANVTSDSSRYQAGGGWWREDRLQLANWNN